MYRVRLRAASKVVYIKSNIEKRPFNRFSNTTEHGLGARKHTYKAKFAFWFPVRDVFLLGMRRARMLLLVASGNASLPKARSLTINRGGDRSASDYY